jgi:hypothetical protein
MLEEQLCRTSTYARSYLVRSKRVWNVLPNEIRRNTTPLSSYKHLLKEYYQSALKSTYDSEDARTWKSVCFKCGSARSLLSLPMCCFNVSIAPFTLRSTFGTARMKLVPVPLFGSWTTYLGSPRTKKWYGTKNWA